MAIDATLVRLGLGPKRNHLLTTRGRRNERVRVDEVDDAATARHPVFSITGSA